MHRIRATLRHALNIAIKQDRLIDFNPAAVVELPDADKPEARFTTGATLYVDGGTDAAMRPDGQPTAMSMG